MEEQEQDTVQNDEMPEEESGGKHYMGGQQPQMPGDMPNGMQMPPFNPYMMPPMGYYPYMMPPMPYPPMQGYMPYPPQYVYQPMPPQMQYQMPPVQEEHECGHHQQEDPLGGLFGMFGEMINGNPQLSAVGKMVDSTGSDFLKGLVIGAGAAMLLSSETVRTAITDILGKSVSMFTEEQEENI